MRWRAALAALLAALASSGCLAPLGFGPSYLVERTELATGEGWNRDGHFAVRVVTEEPVEVRVEAAAQDGRAERAAGLSNATLPPVSLELPDGTWTVTYFVGGRKWESQGPARVDATPPELLGLETLGVARQGAYTLGAGASVEPGAAVRVVRQADGAEVADHLPVRLEGLGSGVHGYDVVATDAAGNQGLATVQVRAGAAAQLPPGTFDLGITARYTSTARLWDLTDLDGYLQPAAARQALGGRWLGSGTGLTPDDPRVQEVARQVVQPGMSTGRAALELFRWMVDHTDYDTARLEAKDLLDPVATMEAGGGVCRDLAALYASLLRAAGIPARLVTGYLGGRVGGFHAWVEFYGGDGHGPGPWVPVDVSGVDGAYQPRAALAAFGVRLPTMLGLRHVAPEQEAEDWTHAASVMAHAAGTAPRADLGDNLTAEFREDKAVLCIDPERLARRIAPDSAACGGAFPLYQPDFLERAGYVLDYGATVAPGTRATLVLSYPDPAAVAPDTVEALTYGALFARDPAAGTATGTLQR